MTQRLIAIVLLLCTLIALAIPFTMSDSRPLDSSFVLPVDKPLPFYTNIHYITEKYDSLPSAFGYKLSYSGRYRYGLSKAKGALYFNGHKETYYSQKVLPGPGLNIPGRHVAEDGTIRDGDGYICVAADPSYLKKGATVLTSLGPAKVYDTGCAYGTIDIYVNW